MAKLKQQPRRVSGGLFGKIPWYGKLMLPFALVASLLYLSVWLVSLFD